MGVRGLLGGVHVYEETAGEEEARRDERKCGVSKMVIAVEGFIANELTMSVIPNVTGW
ncbi:hypothetical protein [Leifsonia xyli]|uniref:hypothetical protein n=1 Tax=Leifsonia xyli TaxID=1575 RepID=UPI0002EC516E|nr:hypothetical protein [Leifsonia xyli]